MRIDFRSAGYFTHKKDAARCDPLLLYSYAISPPPSESTSPWRITSQQQAAHPKPPQCQYPRPPIMYRTLYLCLLLVPPRPLQAPIQQLVRRPEPLRRCRCLWYFQELRGCGHRCIRTANVRQLLTCMSGHRYRIECRWRSVAFRFDQQSGIRRCIICGAERGVSVNSISIGIT
jgi:hypothetical protein